MLEQLFEQRKLMKIWDDDSPWDKRREEIKDILQKGEYGYMPEAPTELVFEEISVDEKFCAGKAPLKKMMCRGKVYGREFAFPFSVIIPKKNNNLPFFIHLNFRSDIPDRYQPTEELIDNGFGVLSFCYTDVTSDDGDFSNGLAGVIFNGKARKSDECGKISMWAWAASRVMDYAETLECLDLSRAAVVGHSRLGKTALVAGMMDERFAVSMSNDSGCSGAAISRDKIGEDLDFINKTFPFWFCENYKKFGRREHELTFDQHFLVASIAPRRVYVASAEEDLWADPKSEYLACFGADEVYKKLGLKGLVAPDKIPEVPSVFHNGEIAYHIRHGFHYLSREDWLNYIAYMKTL